MKLRCQIKLILFSFHSALLPIFYRAEQPAWVPARLQLCHVNFASFVRHYWALDALTSPIAHHLLLLVILRLGDGIFLGWAAEGESVQLRFMEVYSAAFPCWRLLNLIDESSILILYFLMAQPTRKLAIRWRKTSVRTFNQIITIIIRCNINVLALLVQGFLYITTFLLHSEALIQSVAHDTIDLDIILRLDQRSFVEFYAVRRLQHWVATHAIRLDLRGMFGVVVIFGGGSSASGTVSL